MKLRNQKMMSQQLKQALIKRRKHLIAVVRKLRIGKMPIPKKTIQLEREYYQMLSFYLKKIFEDVQTQLINKLPEIKRQRESELKVDAYGDFITSIFNGLNIAWGTLINTSNTNMRVETIASKVNKQNLSDQDNIVETVLGVNPLRNETWLSSKMKSFTEENVSLIKTLPSDYFPKLEKIVRSSVEAGESTKSIANKIYKANNVSLNRAKLIARDQVSKFNSSLTELRQKSIGINKYIWKTVGDERVRGNPSGKYPDAKPSHWDLDGQEFSWDKPPKSGVNGERQHPGFAINCITGNSKINLAYLCEKIYRRSFFGEFIEIITKKGNLLLTINHPILTQRGWIGAGFINKGDYIVNICDEDIFAGKSNKNNRFETIENIFNFFSTFDINIFNGFSSQFHGDGIINNKVDIISLDCNLSFKWNIDITKYFCEFILSKSNEFTARNSCDSNLVSMINSLFPSPYSIMRSFCNLLSFFLIGSGKSHNVRLGYTSWLKSKFNNSSMNYFSSNAEINCNSFFAEFVDKIFLSDKFLVNIFFIVRLISSLSNDSTLSKINRKIVGVNSENLSNFNKRHSIVKHFDCVIDKRISKLSIHVYNLQTINGWYIADNYIIKNCRCVALPVLDDFLK